MGEQEEKKTKKNSIEKSLNALKENSPLKQKKHCLLFFYRTNLIITYIKN